MPVSAGQEACELRGGMLVNNVCQQVPDESARPACEASGGWWDSDGRVCRRDELVSWTCDFRDSFRIEPSATAGAPPRCIKMQERGDVEVPAWKIGSRPSSSASLPWTFYIAPSLGVLGGMAVGHRHHAEFTGAVLGGVFGFFLGFALLPVLIRSSDT